MRWITMENIQVDRGACPWLIKNFIDQEAEFVFVPQDTNPTGIRDGIPFDMKGVELGHHGEECSFDAIVKKYKLSKDYALVKMQQVVRLADTGRQCEDQLAYALELLATGYTLTSKDDYEALSKHFHMYDALYAYFKNSLS